jgi:hypothetical protein
MRMPTRSALASAAAVLLIAAGALADSFEAPVFAQADGDGCFSFETVFLTEADGVYFGWENIDGRDNTDLGLLMIDGFCTGAIPPDQPRVETVLGCLVDPTRDGSVTIQYGVCPTGDWTVTTVILRPPVAVDGVSWGVLKQRYH